MNIFDETKTISSNKKCDFLFEIYKQLVECITNQYTIYIISKSLNFQYSQLPFGSGRLRMKGIAFW